MLPLFIEFIGNDALAIHNATFDIAFLRKSLNKAGFRELKNQILDTCKLARKAFLKVPDYRLITLAQYFFSRLSSTTSGVA